MTTDQAAHSQNGSALAVRDPFQMVKLEPARKVYTLEESINIGRIMAASKFFKDTTTQDQAVVKILFGQELGIAPVSAVRGIHVIESSLVLSGNLMATLIRASKRYDYKVKSLTDGGCTLDFYCAETDEETGRTRWVWIGDSTFTREDAVQAGLAGQGARDRSLHGKYPRNMFWNRAMSNGFRWYCPELAGGAPIYTPEEMGAETDAAGEVLVSGPPGPGDSERRRRRFMARATELRWAVSRTRLHSLFGLDGDKGLLAAYVEDVCEGDWGIPLEILEERGDYDAWLAAQQLDEPPPDDPPPPTPETPAPPTAAVEPEPGTSEPSDGSYGAFVQSLGAEPQREPQVEAGAAPDPPAAQAATWQPQPAVAPSVGAVAPDRVVGAGEDPDREPVVQLPAAETVIVGPEHAAALDACHCGLPATAFDDAGRPVCEFHVDGAIYEPPFAAEPPVVQELQHEPAPDAEPPGGVPPELTGSLRSFIDALRLHRGLSETEARARVTTLGRVGWGPHLDAQEISRRWLAAS